MKFKIIIPILAFFLFLTSINTAKASGFSLIPEELLPQDNLTVTKGENITFRVSVMATGEEPLGNMSICIIYNVERGDMHCDVVYETENLTYKSVNFTINTSYYYIVPKFYYWKARIIYFVDGIPLDFNSSLRTISVLPSPTDTYTFYYDYYYISPPIRFDIVYPFYKPNNMTFRAKLNSVNTQINGYMTIMLYYGANLIGSCGKNVYDDTPPYSVTFDNCTFGTLGNPEGLYTWRIRYKHYDGYILYSDYGQIYIYQEPPLNFTISYSPPSDYVADTDKGVYFNVTMIPQPNSRPLDGRMCIYYDFLEKNGLCYPNATNISYPNNYSNFLYLFPPIHENFGLNLDTTYYWGAEYTFRNGTNYQTIVLLARSWKVTRKPIIIDWELQPENNYSAFVNSSLTFNVKIKPRENSRPLDGRMCIYYDFLEKNGLCYPNATNISYPNYYENSLNLQPPLDINFNLQVGNTYYWGAEYIDTNGSIYQSPIREYKIISYPYQQFPPSQEEPYYNYTYQLPVNETGIIPQFSIYWSKLFGTEDMIVGLSLIALFILLIVSILVSINMDIFAGIITLIFGFLVFIRIGYFPIIFLYIFIIISAFVFVYVVRRVVLRR